MVSLCLAVCASALSCSKELLPTEPEGAYMLWREAFIGPQCEGEKEAVEACREKREDIIYDFLDKETHKVFDERVEVLKSMQDEIQRFLPQVDQKLAREQTGVVLLDMHGIEDGRGLFKALFKIENLKMTPEIEVGTEVSEVEINEEGTEAAIVVYAVEEPVNPGDEAVGQQFLLRKEEEGLWRITSWRQMSIERTKWILDNRSALEQTVQDLINEEKAEVDVVIKYLLKEDKRRREATTKPKK